MKKITSIIIALFITSIVFSQQIGDGHAPIINDFTGALKSGAYTGFNAIGGTPDVSSSAWQHLFLVRHKDQNNNHQLQIASSYAVNDRLFFRKIVVSSLLPSNPIWVELATRGPNTFTGTQIINGNVGIGTTNPDAKLAVNGTIHSKEVKVDLEGWSDFVFKKEYNLPTLAEVERHINEKGHLENIPNEEEVLKNGINLGEMNAKLLQKIEELTLYMIEMKKENIQMKSKQSELENTVKELNTKLK
ncbi:hypothetical protein LNQ49_22245 [Flavobacterium sp. F-65]|uniref:Cell wall anchor protein n=1 Tax=Flavobacterium pisciphilum TaxID=2893755 RepID=A0ABS8MZV7_9FLAO|nr:hypothetical protein [Flavobacterium sp. F-65]MCC9074318.1 hypothetical protein [Flavobacterium sp. F-65]